MVKLDLVNFTVATTTATGIGTQTTTTTETAVPLHCSWELVAWTPLKKNEGSWFLGQSQGVNERFF